MIKGKARRRGYNLVEIIVALGLLGFVIALALPRLQYGKSKAGPRVLANILAEEIRQARLRAMASMRPAGVTFPSNKGAAPYSQSCCLLEGEPPRIARLMSYAQEFPSCCIFIGRWDTEDGTAVSYTNPDVFARGDTFDARLWRQSGFDNEDPVLVFTPAGTVRSDGIPIFGSSRHIIVAAGVQCEADSSGGDSRQRVFALRRAGLPYSISISPLGDVTVTEGVYGASKDQVTLASGNLRITDPAVFPQSLRPAAGNRTPRIEDINIRPESRKGDRKESAATVLPGSLLTLEVTASDGDGDSLSIQWSVESTDPPGLAFGAFSGFCPMEWDATDRVWKARTMWAAPLNAAPGHRYILACTATDDGRPGRSITERRFVEVLPRGKICYLDRPCDVLEAVSVNLDGSGLTRLGENSAQMKYFSLSPDGARLAYIANRDRRRNMDSLFVLLAPDGALPVEITDQEAMPSPFSWSPHGTKIVFAESRSHDDVRCELYITDLEGEEKTRLTSNSRNDIQPCWSPDCERIAFSSNRPGNYEIYVCTKDGRNPLTGTRNSAQRLTLHSAEDSQPAWKPDGTLISFVSRRTGSRQIYLARPNGSHPDTGIIFTPKRITSQATDAVNPFWSPDGRSMGCAVRNGDSWDIIVFDPANPSVTRKVVTTRGEDMPWPIWVR
jgi:TolB protein